MILKLLTLVDFSVVITGVPLLKRGYLNIEPGSELGLE